MLRGELTGLRAHTDNDIEVFETELLTDVETRIRATGRPWLPVAPGAADSPYRQAEDLAGDLVDPGRGVHDAILPGAFRAG